jgi:hypothetical protein
VKSALVDPRSLEHFVREDWGLPAREAKRLASAYFRDRRSDEDRYDYWIQHFSRS